MVKFQLCLMDRETVLWPRYKEKIELSLQLNFYTLDAPESSFYNFILIIWFLLLFNVNEFDKGNLCFMYQE